MGLYARGFPAPLGLAHREDTLYVSSRGSVTALRDSDRDGQPDDVETIVSELPTGIHQNNGLAFGPDGKMYLTLGSTCNACKERSELSATILQFNLDGTDTPGLRQRPAQRLRYRLPPRGRDACSGPTTGETSWNSTSPRI